jgi:hypothetical protein
MAVAYILAHFDDEYGAFPLVLEALRAGQAQHFFYVADYARNSEQRFAESRSYLRRLGVEPASFEHCARGAGVMDGAVYRGLDAIYPLLRDQLTRLGPLEKIVTPAWEGGHADHDMCAVLAAILARDLDVAQVEQFSLYNGAGLLHPLFRAAWPLPENGDVRRVGLSPREVLQWAADVRFFPSQAKTWLGLWPALFLTVLRRGWGVQQLHPQRIAERPHAGPLYYERAYGIPYAETRAAADRLLRTAPGPAARPGIPPASADIPARSASRAAP